MNCLLLSFTCSSFFWWRPLKTRNWWNVCSGLEPELGEMDNLKCSLLVMNWHRLSSVLTAKRNSIVFIVTGVTSDLLLIYSLGTLCVGYDKLSISFVITVYFSVAVYLSALMCMTVWDILCICALISFLMHTARITVSINDILYNIL